MCSVCLLVWCFNVGDVCVFILCVCGMCSNFVVFVLCLSAVSCLCVCGLW